MHNFDPDGSLLRRRRLQQRSELVRTIVFSMFSAGALLAILYAVSSGMSRLR